MADNNSLRDVIRQYLDSEKVPDSIRSIGELIASGEFSCASFDELMQTEGLLGAPNLKETLLDLTLIFTRECVKDHYLSEVEIAELDSLVTIFRIDEGDFYELRRDAVQEIISAQATWMLGDLYVTEQEELLQRDLQRLFGLSYDQYVTLLHPLVKKHIEFLERKKLAAQDYNELKLIDALIQNMRSVFLVGKNETNETGQVGITFERPMKDGARKMTFHPDSASMVLYLRNSINELIGPIESVWKEGDSTVDGRKQISLFLFAIGHYFATVDGDLSDVEISFLADVMEFLTGTDYSSMPIEVLRPIFRKHYTELSVDYPQPSLELASPIRAIRALRAFDAERGRIMATMLLQYSFNSPLQFVTLMVR